ncbi:hypothetical protein GPECTOR_7g999 [Gonium pectorale]|uniref:O-fucosyltransferase family protein n=1 Tax=Gonium pectorale TaxID=33097 RepID=A0A150GUN1_GONPE|nr:hypothetical protein GPECTOR_7g999 [Gonium pectorale]|eukprot:KXZ53549.1 hypothetical protein GPECTOR_7g999 [Gonium pectorale]
MNFSLVFNFEHLSRHRPIVTLDERRATGWDSRVEAVVHFGDKFLDQIKNLKALNVSDEGAHYLDFERFTCNSGQLTNMKEELAEYETIAVIVYENIVRDAGHGVRLRVTGELCHDEYLQVSAQLTKSETLVTMAHEFRQQKLGGRYLAVHIRPYPDKCISAWRRREWRPELAKKLCKNSHLRDVFINQTARAMEKNNLWGVFVMCLPELRPIVTEMYGAAGIKPVFYDMDELEKAVGYRSTSLLGMVEGEISYEADMFIGTSYSSMSSIIMQERFARGKAPRFTTIFTKTSR